MREIRRVGCSAGGMAKNIWGVLDLFREACAGPLEIRLAVDFLAPDKQPIVYLIAQRKSDTDWIFGTGFGTEIEQNF